MSMDIGVQYIYEERPIPKGVDLSKLQYIKSTERKSMYAVVEEYPDCKVLMVDLDVFNMPHVTGTVYAVSYSKNTYKELRDLLFQMQDSNRLAMIVGSYGGVHYIRPDEATFAKGE